MRLNRFGSEHPNAVVITVMLIVGAFAALPVVYEMHREMKSATGRDRPATVTLTCFDQNMVAQACEVVRTNVATH